MVAAAGVAGNRAGQCGWGSEERGVFVQALRVLSRGGTVCECGVWAPVEWDSRTQGGIEQGLQVFRGDEEVGADLG